MPCNRVTTVGFAQRSRRSKGCPEAIYKLSCFFFGRRKEKNWTPETQEGRWFFIGPSVGVGQSYRG